MDLPVPNGTPSASRKLFSPAVVVAVALAAIVGAYFLAIADLGVDAKTRGFSVIIAGFLAVVVGLHFLQSRHETRDEPDRSDRSDVDAELSLLDEARDLFAGALAPDDTFRLAASRIGAVVPFGTIVLYVYDERADRLRVMHADGTDAAKHRGVAISPREGQPGECYCTKRVQLDASSAAIPLENGDSAFGVLQLLFGQDNQPAKPDRTILEAIGYRIGPLVMSSVSFERSRATALVDTTTDLPNERAFYLVLENHIAESQRNRHERPLTVLTLDVRAFDDINHRFGHASGDRVLAFVAEVVKEHLRQMDFFARSAADEFLVVLPTADKEVTHEIIARIQTGFFGRKFKVSDGHSIEIELNVGWAAFGSDGETPGSLLAVARERKVQSKSVIPPKVLWFPTEMVN
jgi:diguanylate cyclase (GGDEF)-like protein